MAAAAGRWGDEEQVVGSQGEAAGVRGWGWNGVGVGVAQSGGGGAHLEVNDLRVKVALELEGEVVEVVNPEAGRMHAGGEDVLLVGGGLDAMAGRRAAKVLHAAAACAVGHLGLLVQWQYSGSGSGSDQQQGGSTVHSVTRPR